MFYPHKGLSIVAKNLLLSTNLQIFCGFFRVSNVYLRHLLDTYRGKVKFVHKELYILMVLR